MGTVAASCEGHGTSAWQRASQGETEQSASSGVFSSSGKGTNATMGPHLVLIISHDHLHANTINTNAHSETYTVDVTLSFIIYLQFLFPKSCLFFPLIPFSCCVRERFSLPNFTHSIFFMS